MSGIWRWLETHAEACPDKPAIRFEGDVLTYGALARRVASVAAHLTGEVGLKHGDRFGYLGYNTPDQLVLTLAAARAGLMIISLNWRLAPPELAYILNNAGAGAVYHQTGFAGVASDISKALPDCSIEPASVLYDIQATAAAPTGEEDDPLLLVYTSGTTGQPKGAVLTQGAVQVNALNAQHMHDMTPDDHILTVLPMFHVGGLNIQTLPALMCGATVTLHQRFDPALTLQAFRRERPTLTVQVPATMQGMISHPLWPDADLSSLRSMSTGSTDVPVRLIEPFQDRGVPVIQIYGSTETGPVAIYQRAEEARATTGSIGRCGLKTDVRLIDSQGEDVPDGADGEILVRGGHVAKSYWQDEAMSTKTFTDGWFHSGDIASRDETGLYWFKGRSKNVIISGGENIYPAELERVLSQHPGIAEAAVVGREDERWGAVPVAVVVRRDVALERDDILALFDGRLARFKHPKHVLFLDALPRNVMGKVMLDDLRERVRCRD